MRGRTNSTYEVLTKSLAALKVNSQKSQDRFLFGSDRLVTDGSTSEGPGLRRKVKVPSTENQIRPPVTILLQLLEWHRLVRLVLPWR